MTPEITLVPLTMDDEWFTRDTETDPVYMAELGGPTDPSEIPSIHARRVQGVESGENWYFTIRLGHDGPLVGSVCLWDDGSHGPNGSEIGWGILPAYQGRGLAGAAVRRVVDLARADGRWGDMHAYPGATNVASNALARSAGFEHVGEVDIEFRGHPLHVNDWVLRAR